MPNETAAVAAPLPEIHGNGKLSPWWRRKLLEKNIQARIVSMPSWELFEAQPREYRDTVLPPAVGARLAVEVGVSQGWHRYVGSRGDVLAVDRFGASAPGAVVMREYGFTADNVCRQAVALLETAP